MLEYALAADKAAEKYDIDVLFICPTVEIRRIVENTKNLIVLAPYMDTLRPGRGMADILPEALKAAGAEGVVVNHCEKPMSLPQIKATIDRANELDMLVFACTDPNVAGDMLLPMSSLGTPEIPDEVYDIIKKKWEKELNDRSNYVGNMFKPIPDDEEE